MKPGFVCVAGIGQPDGPHVRPVLTGRLSVALLEKNGGPFDIANEVDLGACQPSPRPPETEDHVFDPTLARVVRALPGDEFWQQLEAVARDSLADLFGDELHEQSSGAVVDAGAGAHSLGCLRPASFALYVNRWGNLRAGVSDGTLTIDLSVTDLRLYESNNITIEEGLVADIQHRIDSGVPVILSVGLARAYQAKGDTQLRHWLQVNNVHLADNPAWRLA